MFVLGFGGVRNKKNNRGRLIPRSRVTSISRYTTQPDQSNLSNQASRQSFSHEGERCEVQSRATQLDPGGQILYPNITHEQHNHLHRISTFKADDFLSPSPSLYICESFMPTIPSITQSSLQARMNQSIHPANNPSLHK